MQPEELSENQLMDINEKSGCDEKDEGWCHRRSNINKKLHIKGTLGEQYKEMMLYFTTVKVQRIKCWKLIQCLKGV